MAGCARIAQEKMNIKQKTIIISLLATGLLISSCWSGQLFGQPVALASTPTNTASHTAAPTNPPKPTATATPVPSTPTRVPPTATPLTPKTAEEVPAVEAALVRDLKNQGVANRFAIPELLPTAEAAEGGIVFSEGADGTLKVSTEFAGDLLLVGGGLAITLQEPLELHGKISLLEEVYNVQIHRFRGKVPIAAGYVFVGVGDDLNLLTFARIPNVGYLYLRGMGQVILPNGEAIQFGD